jgi:hypothetical protein
MYLYSNKAKCDLQMRGQSPTLTCKCTLLKVHIVLELIKRQNYRTQCLNEYNSTVPGDGMRSVPYCSIAPVCSLCTCSSTWGRTRSTRPTGSRGRGAWSVSTSAYFELQDEFQCNLIGKLCEVYWQHGSVLLRQVENIWRSARWERKWNTLVAFARGVLNWLPAVQHIYLIRTREVTGMLKNENAFYIKK